MNFDPPIPFDDLVRLLRVFPKDGVLHAGGHGRHLFVKSPDGETVYGWLTPRGAYVTIAGLRKYL